MNSRPVYITASARVPFVKSMTYYRGITNQSLMIASLQALVKKINLEGRVIGDVALGALINSASNWNLARECVLGTSLNPHTPGYTIQRACGTSLEAALQIVLKIAHYQIDSGIAAGVDTNSDMPLMWPASFSQKLFAFRQKKTWAEKFKILTSLRRSDFIPLLPTVAEPRTHLSMGEHCEKMVKEWNISREAQDELAFKSHQNGLKAYEEGFFNDLIYEFQGLKRDSALRSDTSLEKLAKLKPVFDKTPSGTLTAGNSSPLTDGSAAVYFTSKTLAEQFNYPLLARFVDAQVAAVDFVRGEGLLMAPTQAVFQLLQRHRLSLQDFDFYEIHEAFAGQVLATLKAWCSADYCQQVLKAKAPLGAIDLNKLNVKGSSLALGHPFAATGARIIGTLAKLISQKGSGRGLISICTAGGMGVAAILEAV